MSTTKCKNNPNSFCYYCGEYVPSMQRFSITLAIKTFYFDYFKIEITNLDESRMDRVPKKNVQNMRDGIEVLEKGRT